MDFSDFHAHFNTFQHQIQLKLTSFHFKITPNQSKLNLKEVQDVLHFIELHYFENGTLYKAIEDIRPDTLESDSDLSATFPSATCNSHCYSADLSYQGGFDEEPSFPAPCAF